MLFTAKLNPYIIIPLYSLAFILHLWVCLVEYGGCTQSCLIFPSPDEEFLEDEGLDRKSTRLNSSHSSPSRMPSSA